MIACHHRVKPHAGRMDESPEINGPGHEERSKSSTATLMKRSTSGGEITAYIPSRRTSSKTADAVDFSSNETLSLGASGVLRADSARELDRHPDIPPGAGSSRVMAGNYAYLEQVEAEIVHFHGAEAGLIMGSGFGPFSPRSGGPATPSCTTISSTRARTTGCYTARR